MLAITEYGSQMFSFRNNLQKNFIQCHKATPVGLGKLRNVVMHKKKKGCGSYDGSASYSTGIDPKPMDSSQNR